MLSMVAVSLAPSICDPADENSRVLFRELDMIDDYTTLVRSTLPGDMGTYPPDSVETVYVVKFFQFHIQVLLC